LTGIFLSFLVCFLLFSLRSLSLSKLDIPSQKISFCVMFRNPPFLEKPAAEYIFTYFIGFFYLLSALPYYVALLRTENILLSPAGPVYY
jgi:hypothetical protein